MIPNTEPHTFKMTAKNVSLYISEFFSAMTIKDTMMPVISSYHGATTFGQTSPGTAASRPYQQSASPGPSGQEIYNQSPEQSYVQATSPQPSGFQALAVNRVRHFSKKSYLRSWSEKKYFVDLALRAKIFTFLKIHGLYICWLITCSTEGNR